MDKKSSLDPTEIDLPDTLYARDIDNTVFDKIVEACLSHIEGVTLTLVKPKCTFFERLIGQSRDVRSSIHVEQDEAKHSVKISIDVTIAYGESIPEKAEEVQHKVSQEITSITGLHVSCVHLNFKNVAID